MVLSPAYLVLVAVSVALALITASTWLRRHDAARADSHAERLLLVGGLVVGTCTHVENTLRAGYLPAPNQPLAFNLYWTALTFLDPLAAVCLVRWPRLGLGLTVAIMATDLPINVLASGDGPLVRCASWPLAFQALFTAVLVAVAPRIWRQPARP